jgi:hypothetical protein
MFKKNPLRLVRIWQVHSTCLCPLFLLNNNTCSPIKQGRIECLLTPPFATSVPLFRLINFRQVPAAIVSGAGREKK